MKQRIIPYLVGILTSALVLAGFLAGRVSAAPAAATGCFPDTNGHWAETFICWLKDNSISSGYGDGTYKPENGVTRAEMSIFLQKIFNLADASAQSKANTAESNAKVYADSLVNTPPENGYLTVRTGIFEWQPAYGPALPTVRLSPYGSVELSGSLAGTYTFMVSPTFPAQQYSYYTRFSTLEFCYQGTAGATLTRVKLETFEDNNYSPTTLLNTTALSGYGNCPYLFLPTPANITARNYLLLSVEVNLADPSDYLSVSTVNFYFFPR